MKQLMFHHDPAFRFETRATSISPPRSRNKALPPTATRAPIALR